jgi:hypothetical protein
MVTHHEMMYIKDKVNGGLDPRETMPSGYQKTPN